MNEANLNTVESLFEMLISQGDHAIAPLFTALMNIAMRIEREQYLKAGHYERNGNRRGYANGFKPKHIDTQVGTIELEVPKTAGCDEPFYPQSLERGRRSSRALMLAFADMYVKGVSTRDVEDIMEHFGLKSVSSSQVSRATKLLDEELENWRNRPLGEVAYLQLDARYEKVRMGGIVRDAAILIAIGCNPGEQRRVLGVSCALSEAETHWRDFLEALVKRGLRGVKFITSDAHSGLEAARKAVFGGTPF